MIGIRTGRHSTLFRTMVSNEIKTEMDGFCILSFLTARVNHLWLLLQNVRLPSSMPSVLYRNHLKMQDKDQSVLALGRSHATKTELPKSTYDILYMKKENILALAKRSVHIFSNLQVFPSVF